MKKTFTKRFFSVLLSLVMLMGLLPTAVFPVSAAELIGEDTISSVAIMVDRPIVGEPLSNCVPVTTLCDISCTWSVRGLKGITEVPATTIAEAGTIYYLAMVLTPKIDLYTFADSVTGTVNGNTVTVEWMSSTRVVCKVSLNPVRPAGSSGSSATLGDVDFGTKAVGYDSVADHPVITNNGNQTLQFGSAYMKAEMTGDTSAFIYGFNTRMGAINVGDSSDTNLYVRLNAGLAVGTYTATMTLTYDPDGSGTEYDWEVLGTATITVEIVSDTRTVIDTVVANVTNIIPTYGSDVQYPTFEVIEGSPAHFSSGVWKKWNETTSSWDQKNPGSATFDEGIWYYLVQVRIDGTSGTTHKLADSMSITINGAGSWTYDTPDVNPTFSYIWVSSPEFTVEAPALNAYTVSGNITSFNSDTDNVTLQLIAEGYSEADYEVIVKGNTAAYSIEGVVAGTYTLRVVKNNHVTREYEIVVADEDIVQDVKIHLIGDINGDGRIMVTDYNAILRHVKKTKSLEGYEFDCADIDGNGRIMVTDYNAVLRHVKKTSSLW